MAARPKKFLPPGGYGYSADKCNNGARLIGYVDVQYKELGSQREPTEKWGYDKLMAALREHRSEAEIEKLAAEGAAWSQDQAVEEARKV